MGNIKEIMTAIGQFQDTCPKIELDETVKVKTNNGSYNFKFASMPNIVNTTKKPMREAGLVHTFRVEKDGAVHCLLCHTKSGELLTSELKATADNMNPQQIGSAITYSKRYLLAAMLGIVTEEDDDGNAATGNGIENKPGSSQPQTTKPTTSNKDPKDKEPSGKAKSTGKDKTPERPEALLNSVQRTVYKSEIDKHWDGKIIDGLFIELNGQTIEPPQHQINKLKEHPKYKK